MSDTMAVHVIILGNFLDVLYKTTESLSNDDDAAMDDAQ